MDVSYAHINVQNRPDINTFLEERWGSTVMAVRGRPIDMTALDGIVALLDGEIVGLATYEINGANCELVSLDSRHSGMGIGMSLLAHVEEIARKRGCKTLSLITTNDNTRAMRFYQKHGFSMAQLFPYAVAKARVLKPSIPLLGEDGIKIEHELEFVKEL